MSLTKRSHKINLIRRKKWVFLEIKWYLLKKICVKRKLRYKINNCIKYKTINLVRSITGMKFEQSSCKNKKVEIEFMANAQCLLRQHI